MIKNPEQIKSQAEIKKLAFLYEASNVLFSSLEYSTTYNNIAHLCVPDLADFCLIDIKKKNGTIKRVTAVHADPVKAEVTLRLCMYPPSEFNSEGPAKVFKTGRIEIVQHIDDKWLSKIYADDNHRAILQELHPKSGIYIPLKIRGETRGVLSLISTDKPRKYTEDDLAIVRGLATRISITLDNAQLYQEAQEELKKRQEVEEELIKSKQQLEVFFQNVADGITVQDQSGSLVYANDAAARASGFKNAKEMLKTPVAEFIKRFEMTDENGNPFPTDKMPGRRALQGDKEPQEVIRFVIKKSGEVRYALVKATPIFDLKKNVKFAVNIFNDITERKEEDRRINQFIGFAGHELKSPLASIKAFVQLLKKKFEKQNDKTAIDYLSKVDIKINLLTKLINDYLDITKIRAGKLEYFDEVISFDDLLKEVVEDIQENTAHAIKIKGNCSTQIIADKNRLIQVLTNLIQNAVKYSPDAKEIIIRVGREKDRIQCSIKDYGIGIAQDKILHIFEPYYRAADPAKGKFPGLGLGLYLCSEIVKRYNGNIEVESKEGKGSIFTLYWPVWVQPTLT